MPTYDYICDGCGHEFEAFESIKADPQTECPECKEARLRRKIGAGGRDFVQGFRLLPDRLPQRLVQERRQGGQTLGIFLEFLREIGLVVLQHAREIGLVGVQAIHVAHVRDQYMIRGKCPICSQSFEIETLGDLPSFPFCSERCRLVDLGRWIDGDYAIPGPPAPPGTDRTSDEPEDD